MDPLPNRSPAAGDVPVEALVFDTFGTVCDFYEPLKNALAELAVELGVDCDAGRMAIDWRTAYIFSTYTQGTAGGEFLPLRDINRTNLLPVVQQHWGVALSDEHVHRLVTTWERLEPWPDAVEGLSQMQRHAIIAPLSNANFPDMVRLARYARLPWDIVLGSSIAGHYKPHPQTYIGSVAALDLAPEQVCMVAAHQRDLAFAAGHGMQTAFVRRPLEFGGPVKPADPDPEQLYLDHAEIHVEGEWTWVADDFLDLAQQLAGHYGSAGAD